MVRKTVQVENPRVKRGLKWFFRGQLRRLGFDIVRYRARPKWPEEDGRFEYQNKLNQFHIAPDAVVLDVGSGHYPFPFATILSDLYLEESPHRTENLVRDHRPLLKLDIRSLPFAEKSIDFVYCSHILEHVEDPLQACLEIMRVGKQGYIETPTLCKDGLFAWSGDASHRWHVLAIDNTIFFFEYSDRQKKGIRSRAWQDLIFADSYHPLQAAFYENQDFFNTMFMWSNLFRVFVFRLDGTVQSNDQCSASRLQR